ncbi:MAG: hypothetical protein ACI8S6_000208, partial [Myxococcota bacterium]
WWMSVLPHGLSRDVLFVLNQLSWLLLGGVLWRWFRADPLLLAAIGVSLTPLTHSGRLGQVNGLVAALVALALWRRSGGILSIAAMIKMSPALYLPVWAAQGRWRAVAAAVIGAVVLSILSLLVVPWEVQLHFYRDLLPGFSSGSYNSLQVPISLNANHSIPSALSVIWPGPDANTLAPAVRRLAAGMLLGVLSGVGWLSRRSHDALSEGCLLGALTVALVLLPVFAYEHHLSLLVLPVAALGTALLQKRLPAWVWPLALLGYLGIAWPLSAFRGAIRAYPDYAWAIRESRLAGALLLGGLCLWASLRAPSGQQMSAAQRSRMSQ